MRNWEVTWWIFISEVKESEWLRPTKEENRYTLFKKFRKLGQFNMRKTRWICREFSDRLLKLFMQFPNEHKVIRKYLNMFNSAYYRLVKESKKEWPYQRGIKIRRRAKKLKNEEKLIFELMVKPSIPPLTLNKN